MLLAIITLCRGVGGGGLITFSSINFSDAFSHIYTRVSVCPSVCPSVCWFIHICQNMGFLVIFFPFINGFITYHNNATWDIDLVVNTLKYRKSLTMLYKLGSKLPWTKTHLLHPCNLCFVTRWFSVFLLHHPPGLLSYGQTNVVTGEQRDYQTKGTPNKRRDFQTKKRTYEQAGETSTAGIQSMRSRPRLFHT